MTHRQETTNVQNVEVTVWADWNFQDATVEVFVGYGNQTQTHFASRTVQYNRKNNDFKYKNFRATNPVSVVRAAAEANN